MGPELPKPTEFTAATEIPELDELLLTVSGGPLPRRKKAMLHALNFVEGGGGGGAAH